MSPYPPQGEFTRADFDIPVSYVIFIEDSIIKARNGATGAIDFAGTDAATVIQDTVNALTSGRTWKEKVVCKGDFLIKTAIEIPSYTIFELQGRFKIPDNTQINIINVDGKSNVEIIGGELDGNREGNVRQASTSLQNGIWINNSSYVIVRGVKVVNSCYAGIRIEFSSDVLVEGCIAYNNIDNGIWASDSERVNIVGNISNHQDWSGIALIKCNRCNVVGNICTGNGRGLGVNEGKGISIEGTQLSAIVGNVCIGNTGLDGIALTIYGTIHSSYNVVTGNLCEGNDTNGIRIQDSEYCTITGNVCKGNSNRGIYVIRSSNSTVSGNQLSGNAYHGVHIEDSDNCVGSGNAIYSNSWWGVSVKDSDNCLFSNNNCDGNEHGIGLSGETNNCTISNNICQNSVKYGIYIVDSTCDNNLIRENRLSGNAWGNLSDGGTGTIIKRNIGYVTENSGTATITAGNTSVTVTHGLDITPDINKIRITPKDNLGGRSFHVDTVGATSFNINISSSDTVDHTFGWQYIE